VKKSPKYYWLIGVAILLIIAIGYSIIDATSTPTAAEIETSQLVDSRMAIIDKNATARSVIKNMLIDETTKITVISGTALALSDYILAYSNTKKHRGYLDLTNLRPAKQGSYVLWSKSPTGVYSKMMTIPPKKDFLLYSYPPDGHIMELSLEIAGASDQPDLSNIIAIEQIEE